MIYFKVLVWFFMSLLVFLCYPELSQGQQLKGTYSHYLSGPDEEIIFTMTADSFKVRRAMHMDLEEIAIGRYYLSSDTLTMNFIPVNDPAPSDFKIIEKNTFGSPPGMPVRDTESLSVSFRVTKLNGELMQRSFLILRNSEGNNIMSFAPDSAGNFPKLTIQDPYIHDFQFLALGFKSLIIPADTLAGYLSEVSVQLSDSLTYYDEFEGSRRFLVLESNQERLILESLDTRTKWIWKKVE